VPDECRVVSGQHVPAPMSYPYPSMDSWRSNRVASRRIASPSRCGAAIPQIEMPARFQKLATRHDGNSYQELARRAGRPSNRAVLTLIFVRFGPEGKFTIFYSF